MIQIEYSSHFVRKFKRLESGAQDEVIDKIELFKNLKNHARLKAHKLSGKMNGLWAFSVNFRDRIVFYFNKRKQTAYLLDIGDHNIYE